MSASYSVSVRLQRLTTETAHVSVPITAELLRPSAEDPEQMTIDTEKLMDFAIKQGILSTTCWKPDGDAIIRPHPIQTLPDSD
jgi:hypothetical protein